MKKLNITYDTMEIFGDEKVVGETCYTVEIGDEKVVGETCYTVEIGDDKVADRLLAHGRSGIATNVIEKMLRSREILLGRVYVSGSIKHYELVKEG